MSNFQNDPDLMSSLFKSKKKKNGEPIDNTKKEPDGLGLSNKEEFSEFKSVLSSENSAETLDIEASAPADQEYTTNFAKSDAYSFQKTAQEPPLDSVVQEDGIKLKSKKQKNETADGSDSKANPSKKFFSFFASKNAVKSSKTQKTVEKTNTSSEPKQLRPINSTQKIMALTSLVFLLLSGLIHSGQVDPGAFLLKAQGAQLKSDTDLTQQDAKIKELSDKLNEAQAKVSITTSALGHINVSTFFARYFDVKLADSHLQSTYDLSTKSQKIKILYKLEQKDFSKYSFASFEPHSLPFVKNSSYFGNCNYSPISTTPGVNDEISLEISCPLD